MLLALVWLGASLAALVLGLRHRLWIMSIAGLLGVYYGTLWIRVAWLGRKLTWQQVSRPWRDITHS